jgi:DNA-binding MarR family transcriptional regulator
VPPFIASEMTEKGDSDWNPPREDRAGERNSLRTSGLIPPEHLETALKIQAARESRTRFFDSYLFGEPGWDILLALYIAQARGYRLKVSDACFEARVPATTALRWLEFVEEAGLASRRDNALDRRSSFVELTALGVERVDGYLKEATKILS